MNCAQLVGRAVQHGGFTIRFSDDTSPTSGFVSSVEGYERRLSALTPDALEAYLAYVAPLLPAALAVFGDELCLGAWLDGGEWVLDLSIVCRSLDSALHLARANRQLAVYDLQDQCSITVPYAREAACEVQL